MRQSRTRKMNKANQQKTLESINEVTCPELKKAYWDMLNPEDK